MYINTLDMWEAVGVSHKPTIKGAKEERTIHDLLTCEHFYSLELSNASDNFSPILLQTLFYHLLTLGNAKPVSKVL